MGVPRLFQYIIKHYGKTALKHFMQGEYNLTVDNLYLDSNAILHNTAQFVYNYGQNKRPLDNYKDMPAEEKQKKLFEMFFNNIKTLTSIIIPTKILYIAIDGPAPLAKQAQQRQRRFASALEREKTNSDTDDGKSFDGKSFDSNKITPGTLFMLELTKYMHTAIRKEMNDPKSPWHKIQVIFSPAIVPGEGEHKILDYIRASPNKMQESHCLFGPDADLIMLTLAAHVPKMFLFREDQYNIGFYDILDMGKIRNELMKTLHQSPGFTSRKRTLDDISNDFIILGFFVGNDFLPKIQMFMYLEDGLELMVRTYSLTSGGGLKNVLSVANGKGRSINHEGFTRFVEDLARREHAYILEQATPKADKHGNFLDKKFDNNTLLKYVDQGRKTLNMEEYRKAYYEKAGIAILPPSGDDTSDGFEDGVKQMCLDYLRAIAWVFQYYIVALPSWRDFYAWHYAPLMIDLAQIMRDATPKDLEFIYTFKKDKPSKPFVQLLSVLPPKSAYLLPPPFRHLLTSESSPLVKSGIYPSTFEIDLEGKTKEHMGIALLPFVNIDKIEKEYQPVADKLKNKYVRNSIGKAELFKYEPVAKSVTYSSDYGNIKNLRVMKTYV